MIKKIFTLMISAIALTIPHHMKFAEAAAVLENPLYHAAKWGGFRDFNGTGTPDTYFYVANPHRLEQQLNRSFLDILSRGVSQVAPVVSVDEANRTQSGDELYMAFFKPQSDDHWQGNLKKYGLRYLARNDCGRSTPEWTVVDQFGNMATQCDGAFKPGTSSHWSNESDSGHVHKGGVGVVLMGSVPSGAPYYSFRKIYTYKEGSVVPFTRDNITNTDLNVENDQDRFSIVNYLYGYTFAADMDEDPERLGNPLAKRNWILGDIIHSEPKIIDYVDPDDAGLTSRYIAVGANDGMLHVFDDSDGSEVFAFVPPDLMPRLQEFASPGAHIHMVDGSPALFQAQTTTDDGYPDKTLVFGQRRGGRSYWAFDVSSPDPENWFVKWHIEGGFDGETEKTTGFGELGYTWNKPYFARIRTASDAYKNIVVFAGGYDELEDGFPENFFDTNQNGKWDSGESFEDTPGGTVDTYDKFNPGKDNYGRGIFVVDLADGSLLFKATYGDGSDFPTGKTQQYSHMKYCFPADPTVIPLSSTKLLIYAADIYGQIWKITYNYFADSTGYTGSDLPSGSTKWRVKRLFQSNPGSNLTTGNPVPFQTEETPPALNSADAGRKTFYSPDVSYFGNCWTNKPVLYFGTGDRAHPKFTGIHNRFYVVADHDSLTDETDLLNLTCNELDFDSRASAETKWDLRGILKNEEVCRGFYRVMDLQSACSGETTDHTGQQVLSQPTLFNKNVYFSTYQPTFKDPRSPVGNAFIYALDYCWGTSAFNYNLDNDSEMNNNVRNITDTYQIIQNSAIPSGVRVITRAGYAAGLISAGGNVSGVGEDLSTTIPGPPGGVSQILWETN